MANTIVCLSIASAYRFWFSVLGRMVRPRADRMPTVSTSAGRTARSAPSIGDVRPDASALGAEHGRGPLDRVRGQVGALAQQLDQLVEERGHQGGLSRVPGRGDLVAPDVDVGVEFPLNHVQQLVPGTEQADHRMTGGDHDLHLRSWFAFGFSLPVAVGGAAGVQVIVSDVCQFDALADPEDRPPSVLSTMLSGITGVRGESGPGPGRSSGRPGEG